MARGGPRKAGGPSKKGSKAAVTLLTTPDESDLSIPPMPPAQDWLPPIDPYSAPESNPLDPDVYIENADSIYPTWNPAVVRWWKDIWSSPMSSEFVESDIHGLYLGCYLLHESLNPEYKLADRISSIKAFENTLKNYGLTPSARETLRWQIAQGTSAQRRTDQLRSDTTTTTNNLPPVSGQRFDDPAHPTIEHQPNQAPPAPPGIDQSMLDLYRRNS